MAVSRDVGRTDRIERLRQVIEEQKDDPDLFSPDFMSLAPLDVAGRRDTNAGGLELTRLFSEHRISVEDAIEEGDKVVVRWRLKGIWSGGGAFRGIKGNGKPVEVTGINVYRFVGGKIVGKTGEFDVSSFHAQVCNERVSGEAVVNPADCVQAIQVLARPEILKAGLRFI